MRLFDTHCHFEGDATETAAMLERAAAAGVEAIMAVGGSPKLNASALEAVKIANAHPGLPHVIAACGYDREQIAIEEIPPLPAGLAAVGEIGLDYHYSPETRSAQLKLFRAQLELAAAAALPVVVHTRDADADTLGALREIPVRGIIHCFTGSPDFCRKLLDLGFFISLSGIVTFRAADNVRESAAIVPDDRLLIETDSPFLAPVPMRGKKNEPAFIEHTATFLAQLRGISPQKLAEITWQNALSVLGKY